MGENLPFAMWRVDNANAWIPEPAQLAGEEAAGRLFSRQFLRHHLWQFPHPALLNAMLEIGADRIMFSTDWPFENIDHAANWFDACPISENDRLKIGRDQCAAAVQAGQ